MRATRALAAPASIAILAGSALSGLTLAALFRMGPAAAAAVAFLPLAAIVAALFLTTGRIALLAAVFVLPMSGIPAFAEPLPLPGASLFYYDLVLGLALGGWAFGALAYRSADYPKVPRTPVLGWPFVLFATAILIATIRGHYEYGATLYGQPLRLVAYAGIVVTLAGVTVTQLYRLLRAILYAGTTAIILQGVYYIATGTSQTDQLSLSTGGTRILSISASLYCASTLFFALLSLQLAPSGMRRLLHLGMVALGLAGVALGFGRAVFTATAAVILLVLLFSRPVRRSFGSVVPLALPFVVLVGIMIPLIAPDLIDTARSRVESSPARDANVRWRVEASKIVLAQVREQPLIGVGFGRTSDFYIPYDAGNGLFVPVRHELGQDPHNGFLYLWAGAGLAGLGTFVLIVLVFARDAFRRALRATEREGRVLVIWAAASLFAFLLNAASGTSFTNPGDLLTIWLLLVIPAAVPFMPRTGEAPVQLAMGRRASSGRRPAEAAPGE